MEWVTVSIFAELLLPRLLVHVLRQSLIPRAGLLQIDTCKLQINTVFQVQSESREER